MPAALRVTSPSLAILGGDPVRKEPMPSRKAMGPDEEEAVLDCLRYYRNVNADPGYQGEFEKRYTDAFCCQMFGGYADAVATGTAALYIAVAALELPKGSEVLVSPITDPGTLSAIILNGLKPRLCDSYADNYNMGVDAFKERVGPQTSAVMVVHSIGRAAPVQYIVEEAHKHGIKVIEDCSQSHGAHIGGAPIGTFGDIAAFSTMYRKPHMSGGSGGIVYSTNEELFHRALAYADRGKPRWTPGFNDTDPRYFMFPALNLHTDEISCAIGASSLGRLRSTIDRRMKFVRQLTSSMSANCKVCRPYRLASGDSPFVLPVMVDDSMISCSVAGFAMAVRAEGIGLNPRYEYLVRDWPWIWPYLNDDFDTSNARAIRDRTFCLFLNENYGTEEVNDIVAAILKVEQQFAV